MKVLEHYHPRIGKEEQTDLISVIVTAYNIAGYIERGVRSVCAQTYGNLEIILVDDGSDDGTGGICDRLAAQDARVRVIHKENGGPSEARNAGIKTCAGSYIGFVDGDDWIDPDMYERMLGAMREQSADVGICRYRQVHADHTVDESKDRAVVFTGQEALTYYVRESREYAIQNAAWNKLYRREVLADLWFPVGKWYEDILFTTRVLGRAECCVYLDTACYNYIIDREGSIMNTQINARTFTDQIPAYYEKTALLKALGRQDLADLHNYFFYKRLLLFYDWLEESDRPERDEYLARLTRIIREDREWYAAAFGRPEADPRDYRKMKLFLRSPARYSRRVRLEKRVIIPLKSKIKRLLTAGTGKR